MEEDRNLFEEVDQILNERQEDENLNPIKTKKIKLKPISLFFIIIIIGIVIIYNVIMNMYHESLYEDDNNYDTLEDDPIYQEYLENYSDDYVSFSEYKQELTYNEFKKLRKNIEIKSSISDDKYTQILICEIINNNDKEVQGLDLSVIYYDGEDMPVKIETTEITAIYANGKYYTYFDLPESYEEYERYEFVLTQGYVYTDKLIDIKNFEVEVEQIGNEITTKVKSKYEKIVDSMRYSIIFYDKEGKITDIQDAMEIDMMPNKEYETTFYKSRLNSNFDRYEININYAYNY